METQKRHLPFERERDQHLGGKEKSGTKGGTAKKEKGNSTRWPLLAVVLKNGECLSHLGR